MIVELFAATKGRLSASKVPLAQDRGKTLTAAPVLIKYLHLLRLSATCSSLEGDNLGTVVLFDSAGASVTTLRLFKQFKAKAQGSQWSGRAGIWYFCGYNILFIIFITIIICSHARCKRSRISVRDFYFIFCCSVSSASCLLLIVTLLLLMS